ncbi:MAG: aspartyl protease family protein [Chitinophagales bacterium]|nr:aspartyl protease family protein [Chitinophagales bacterium]
MRKREFIFVLFLLNSLQGLLQAQTFFQFSNGSEKQKIHFELHRNIIVFPLYLNESGPYNFILDTGASTCVITDPKLVSQLNLSRGKEIVIKGFGEENGVQAFLVHNIVVRYKNVISIPLTMPAFEEDPFYLSEYLGTDIHGILGFEFFNSFHVRINYQNQTITLFKPDFDYNKKKYSAIDIDVRNKKPFIKGYCSFINDSVFPVDLLIDTGAGFPVLLETYSSPSIKIPEKYIEAELGVGLNGVIAGSIARCSLIGFGDYLFHNVVTAFPDYASSGLKQQNEQRNGSIGNFILNRFTIIFDYAGGLMYVKPNTHLREPFVYDRTGLEIIATGEGFVQFIVKTVKTGSPAAEIGILPGDEIEQINFRHITSYTLTEIDYLLSNPKSASITLRIKRNNEIFFMLIEMRDLI